MFRCWLFAACAVVLACGDDFVSAASASADDAVAAATDQARIPSCCTQRTKLDFSGPLITEVTCPKLDGASGDACYFDVSFCAECTAK